MTRTPALLACAFVLDLAAVPARGQAPSGIPWIDVHVHPVSRSVGEADFAARQVVAAMNEAGILRAIAMPTPQNPLARNRWDYQIYREALGRWPERFSFLAGGGTLNSTIQETPHDRAVGEDLRRKFEAMAAAALKDGAIGFGEITAHHLSTAKGHPYESIPADHPLLLLLADIAAKNDVPIDFHFDVVAADMATPDSLTGFATPATLKANLPGFERLLAHNRRARFVWAHAGSDQLGHWTVELSRTLLTRHPNLFMSLRMGPGRVPDNHPLSPEGTVKPAWLRLLQDFPERFVLGTDSFFVGNPATSGPASVFAPRAAVNRQRSSLFLSHLPPDIAQKIATGNARAIYKLTEVSR